MGQTSTKNSPAPSSQQPMRCVFVAARDNHVVVSHNDMLLCQYDYNYPSEQVMKRAIGIFQAGRSVNHNHIQNMLHFSANHINTLCSSIYRLSAYYQYCEQTLLSEIEARRDQDNRPFQQQQLWSILCSCTLAFSYLQAHNIPYNSLTLNDIWLTDKGVIKINHPINLTNIDSQVFNQQYFYAPEQLNPPDASLQINHHKLGVYQLGLALLRCCNLEDTRSYYDGRRVSQNVIGELLLRASTKYEENFINTLITILKEKPEERPMWNQLENVIVASVSEVKRKQSMQMLPLQQLQIRSPIDSLLISKDEISYTVHTNSQPAELLTEETPEIQSIVEPTQSEHDQYTIDEAHVQIVVPIRNDNDHITITQSENLGTVWQSSRRQINEQDSNVLKSSNRNGNSINGARSSLKQPFCHSSPNCFEPLSTSKKSASPQILSQSLKDQIGRYEGHAQNGMRHGYGTFYYSEGGIYTGKWVKGEMHGRGIIYYPSGKIAYEGQWCRDKLHGMGVLYNQEVIKLIHKFDCRNFGMVADYWVKYQGQFNSDNKSGKGKLVLSNGEYFVGEFKDDEVNGKGKFYRTDGSVINGYWRSNLKQ